MSTYVCSERRDSLVPLYSALLLHHYLIHFFRCSNYLYTYSHLYSHISWGVLSKCCLDVLRMILQFLHWSHFLATYSKGLQLCLWSSISWHLAWPFFWRISLSAPLVDEVVFCSKRLLHTLLSYFPDVILNTSIMSPRMRLNLRVGRSNFLSRSS